MQKEIFRKMRKRRIWLLAASAVLVLILVCALSLKNTSEPAVLPDEPEHSEEPAVYSTDPDYGMQESWAYYGIGEDRPVDLFLICPTVDMKDEFNMSMDDEKTKSRFLGALNMERGIYEDSARMFSPYYRQAAMKAYSLEPAEREAHLAFAYRDISAAFSWYLEHENGGRPILLAGFSQGADMCYRLLAEYFDDEQLSSRLVSVYAIGWPCTPEMVEKYPQIRPAAGELDTGVVISFECEAPEVTETFVLPAGISTCSINPLNWRTDSEPADKSLNPGACFPDYKGQITKEAAGLCGCYIDPSRGALKVTDIRASDYPASIPGLPEGSYHIYDYQFFFRSLQKNVQARTEAYLAQNSLPALPESGSPDTETAGEILSVSTAVSEKLPSEESDQLAPAA